MADLKDNKFMPHADRASALISIVEARAKRLLGPETKISKADKELIASAAAKLREDFAGISRFFKSLSPNPDTVDLAFCGLNRLIAELVIISQFPQNTSQARKDFAKLQAAVMRDKKRKQNAPREAALMAAIIAARGNGAAAQPTKEAGAILSDVNKRLRADGFEEVKIDVIRRRLQKFPAHS
jgi:hypothetical protein